jgi:mRNA-degrading endonuclease toxin of MazEF toxin-antitoxin module
MVHIRTIDGDVRVRQHLGTLDAEAMKRVDRALATSLGLP